MIGLGNIIGRSRVMGNRLSGTPFPGEVLTAKGADQWTIDGINIPGETGDTYTVGVRDIGKVIRCGNSRPVTVWHPRDESSVAACYVPWENAYNAVGPDVLAEPGQMVRRWVDIVSGIPVDQVTGNAQPVLGYAEPPEGNLVLWSDDTSKFAGSDGGVVVGPGPLDPNGVQSVEIDFSGGSIWATGAGTPISSNGTLQPVGVRLHVYAYVRVVDGGGISAIRFRNYGASSVEVPVSESWTLVHGVITRAGGVPESVVGIAWNSAQTTPNVYVGRIWAVREDWSPAYVETAGTPVIPDTTNLPRALVFDGDNDRLSFSGAGLSLFSNRKYRSVVASVIDTNRGGGSTAHFVLHAGQPAPNNVSQFSVWTRNAGSSFGAEGRNAYDSATAVAQTASQDGWHVLFGEADGVAGEVRLTVDANTPIITSAVTGTTSPNPGSGMAIGNHWATPAALPGRIGPLTILAGNTVPTTLSLNRIRQFTGLCIGEDLDLPVV